MQILGEAIYVDKNRRRHTVEGIGNFPDDMAVQSLKVEGDFSFEEFSCDTIKVTGECHGDSLTAKNFFVEGTLEVDSVKIAEQLNVEGSLKVANIEASEVFIESRSGSIGNIKCRSLKVFHDETSFRRPSRSRVQIKNIEAENVHLENCKVDVIRCQEAFIGKNCAIEKLFVAGECSIAPDSTVGETIHTASDS